MLEPLRLVQPGSVAEASRALGELGERAKLYAGGAELLLLLRQQLIDVDVLVDIKRIAELRRFSTDTNGMRIGSCMTHQELADHPVVRRQAPAFASAEAQVANPRVRHQGTLGGNLCFNDPHSDPGTVLLVHEASVKLADYECERQIPLEQFFQDMYATALKPHEVLTELQIPPLPRGMGSAYLRLHRYQRPTLGAAVAVRVVDGTIAACRLAIGCVGPKPLRLHDLEDQLKGQNVSDAQQIVSDNREPLRQLLRPVDDLLGSSDYKIHMSCVMIAQALEQAAQESTHGNS